MAAALALEDIAGITPPSRAVALRNVAAMAEQIQSDVRHSVLTFAVDFTSKAYSTQPLYDEAVERYAGFQGSSFLEVVRELKRIVKLAAILGGQWPHSTFIVPGGITSIPQDSALIQCQLLVMRFRKWYEQQVLGCSIRAMARGQEQRGPRGMARRKSRSP